MTTKTKTSKGHKIPMEIVHKILLMRPPHKNALSIQGLTHYLFELRYLTRMTYFRTEFREEWDNPLVQLDDMEVAHDAEFKAYPLNLLTYCPQGCKGNGDGGWMDGKYKHIKLPKKYPEMILLKKFIEQEQQQNNK